MPPPPTPSPRISEASESPESNVFLYNKSVLMESLGQTEPGMEIRCGKLSLSFPPREGLCEMLRCPLYCVYPPEGPAPTCRNDRFSNASGPYESAWSSNPSLVDKMESTAPSSQLLGIVKNNVTVAPTWPGSCL